MRMSVHCVRGFADGTRHLVAVVAMGLAVTWACPHVWAQETEDAIDVVEGDDDEVIDINDIVVTGSRTEHSKADAPVATEVIDREEIERSGAQNAAELLAKHNGIEVVRSFRGAGLQLQGLDSRYVLILVDGQRVSGRVNGVLDLTRISTADIARVEVVKGASSALYGSEAIGGVVNIITRDASDGVHGAAGLSAGQLGYLEGDGEISLGSGAIQARFTGGGSRRDSFDLDPSDPATSGSGYTEFHASQSTSYEVSEDLEISMTTRVLRRDQRGVDANSTGAVFDRRNLTETLALTLGPEWKSSDGTRVRLTGNYSLFRDQFHLDQRRSDALDEYQDTRDQLGQIDAQVDWLMGAHFLTTGVEGLYEELESERLRDGNSSRYRGAVYVQDEWSVVDDPWFVVIPGVRLDADSQFGTHPTPKVALRFDPHETVVVRASYGWGFRAPDFKQLVLQFENASAGYFIEGNPDLEPETSQSVTVGFEWGPEPWKLAINGFRHDLTNLITTEQQGVAAPGESLAYTYVNVDAAYSQGIEAQLGFETEWLWATGGYTFTDTRDEIRKRPLEGRARHRGTLDLSLRAAEWLPELGVRAAATGSRPFFLIVEDGVEQSQRSRPFVTLDARMAYTFYETVTLEARGENLLDAGDATTLPITPRTFYMGIEGRL